MVSIQPSVYWNFEKNLQRSGFLPGNPLTRQSLSDVSTGRGIFTGTPTNILVSSNDETCDDDKSITVRIPRPVESKHRNDQQILGQP